MLHDLAPLRSLLGIGVCAFGAAASVSSATAQHSGPRSCPAASAPAAPGLAYTHPPVVLNREERAALADRHHPAALRRDGVGGRVLLDVYLDATGKVTRMRVRQSAGHPALDEAAQAVIGELRFVPARCGEQFVGTWLSLPVVFPAGVPS